MATNVALLETRRAFVRIAVIFFISFLFHNLQLFSVCASIVIDINVNDITFRDIRSCMPMGMLHNMFAATVKQPALINSRSAWISRVDMCACVTRWFCSPTTGL